MHNKLVLIVLTAIIAFVEAEVACKKNEIKIIIDRLYSTESADENLEIWRGTHDRDSLEYYQNGRGFELKENKETICLLRAYYQIVATDYQMNGWKEGSRIRITCSEVNWMIQQSSEWKFSDTFFSDWNSILFNDDSWLYSRHSSFPPIPPTVTTRYYRITVKLPDIIPNFSGFTLGMMSKFGVISYISGNEIFRRNMIPGPVTSQTEAKSEDKEYTYTYMRSDTLAPSSTMVIAVEIHNTVKHVIEEDRFFANLFFIPTETLGSHRNIRFQLLSNSKQSPDTLKRIVDGDRKTSVRINMGDMFQFNYIRSFEQINAYSISIADSTANIPVKWSFMGSMDGSSWKPIDSREGSWYFLSSNEIRIDLPSQIIAYTAYRIIFNSFNSTGSVDVSEVKLLVKLLSPPSGLALQYNVDQMVVFPGQENVLIEPTQQGFHSFSITGAQLPAGLTFSTISGAIHGTVAITAGEGSQQMTITAKHVSTGITNYSTVTSLEVSLAKDDRIRVRFEMRSVGESGNDMWVLQNMLSTVVHGRGSDVGTGDAMNSVRELCIASGAYSLTLSKDNRFTPSRGWSIGSRLRISLITAASPPIVIRIGDVTLYPEMTSLVVPLHLYLYSDGSTWRWLYNPSATVPTDWYKIGFMEAWPYVPSSVQLSQSVWLFRKVILVSSLKDVGLLEMRLFCRPGVVVYVNEREIYRRYVDDTVISSSTVSTRDGAPYWHIFTTKIASASLHAGRNFVAIAVVNANASQRTVDFSAIIMLPSHVSQMGRVVTGGFLSDSVMISDNGHVGNNSAVNLFDGDAVSLYRAIPSTSGCEVVVAFTSDRYEVINKYCITTSFYHQKHDPLKWVIEGSMTGSVYTVLGSVDFTWFARGERKCFSMVTSTYLFYRLTFLQPRDPSADFMISQLRLLYDDVTSMAVFPLSLSSHIVKATVQINLKPSYSVNSEFYHDFSISPPLPAGLQVDEFSGFIVGIPEQSSLSHEYTLSAMSVHGLMSSVILSLSVCDCGSNGIDEQLVRIDFRRFSKPTPPYNSIRVNTFSDSHILSYYYVQGNSMHLHDSTEIGFSVYQCIPDSHFKIVTYYSMADTNRAIFIVKLGGKSSGRSNSLDPTKSSFLLEYDTLKRIHPTQTSWYYLSGETPPDNWVSSSVFTTWSTATPGSFHVVEGITSYYCTTFSAEYAPYVSGFTLAVRTRGGVIMYLNGVEINRVRLPAGEVTHITPATSVTESAEFVAFSGSVQYGPFIVNKGMQVDGAPEGHNNRVCIETHKLSSNSESDDFSCYFSYVHHMSNRVDWGVATGSMTSTENPVEMAWDQLIRNKYFVQSDCSKIWTRYAFVNNRKEFVNYVRFWSGDVANRRPLFLTVEASDDGIMWNTLLTTEQLTWPNGDSYGISKEWILPNNISYPFYQVTAKGCYSEGIEIAEINLFSRRVETICKAESGFPEALEGKVSLGPCPPYHTGSASRICQNRYFSQTDFSGCVPSIPENLSYSPDKSSIFIDSEIRLIPQFSFYADSFTIKPTLPIGLYVNDTSGVIFGIAYVASNTTFYTITATNKRGFTSAVVSITVNNGCPSISDFPAVAIHTRVSFNCADRDWMIGTISRTCEIKDGIAVWSEPDGFCNNFIYSVVVIILCGVILCTTICIIYNSNSIGKRLTVYRYPNGEYELEEIEDDDSDYEYDGDEELPRLHTRFRTRPQMNLWGHPVFVCSSRFLKRPRENYETHYRVPDPRARFTRI